MGPICCPETSIRNFHYLLSKSPEECISDRLCGGSPKSPKWEVKPKVCTKCCHVYPFHDTPHAQPITDLSPYAAQNLWNSYIDRVLHHICKHTFDTFLRVKSLGIKFGHFRRKLIGACCYLVFGCANTNHFTGNRTNIWDFPAMQCTTLWQQDIRDTSTTGFCR
jgi:hypothetical protein